MPLITAYWWCLIRACLPLYASNYGVLVVLDELKEGGGLGGSAPKVEAAVTQSASMRRFAPSSCGADQSGEDKGIYPPRGPIVRGVGAYAPLVRTG
eukprot:1193561-Prorocentrum_minimum.AAC.3